jgi:nitrite reductase/ring-hydroxylating ferredoxin subunit
MSIKWHKIAEDVSELNTLTEIEIGNKKICVVIHNKEFYACAAKCPHASGIMADGYVDALGNIVCPLHRYKFNLKNGINISGEGYFLKTYPVECRNDGVFVGFRQNTFL